MTEIKQRPFTNLLGVPLAFGAYLMVLSMASMVVGLLLIIGLLLSLKPKSFFFETSKDLSLSLFDWFESIYTRINGLRS